jgi:hypothetical protein
MIFGETDNLSLPVAGGQKSEWMCALSRNPLAIQWVIAEVMEIAPPPQCPVPAYSPEK